LAARAVTFMGLSVLMSMKMDHKIKFIKASMAAIILAKTQKDLKSIQAVH